MFGVLPFSVASLDASVLSWRQKRGEITMLIETVAKTPASRTGKRLRYLLSLFVALASSSPFFNGEILPQRLKQVINDRKAATQVLTAKYLQDFPEAWRLCFLRLRFTHKDLRNGLGKFLQ